MTIYKFNCIIQKTNIILFHWIYNTIEGKEASLFSVILEIKNATHYTTTYH